MLILQYVPLLFLWGVWLVAFVLATVFIFLDKSYLLRVIRFNVLMLGGVAPLYDGILATFWPHAYAWNSNVRYSMVISQLGIISFSLIVVSWLTVLFKKRAFSAAILLYIGVHYFMLVAIDFLQRSEITMRILFPYMISHVFFGGIAIVMGIYLYFIHSKKESVIQNEKNVSRLNYKRRIR